MTKRNEIIKKTYCVHIASQNIQIEASDDADAEFMARMEIEIDSIEESE